MNRFTESTRAEGATAGAKVPARGQAGGSTSASEAASSVGVNALMRSMGTTVAGAVMAVMLTSRTVELSPGVAVPAESAFRLCFLIGAAAAFAGALVVLMISRRGGSPAGGVTEVAAEAPAAERVEAPAA